MQYNAVRLSGILYSPVEQLFFPHLILSLLSQHTYRPDLLFCPLLCLLFGEVTYSLQ